MRSYQAHLDTLTEALKRQLRTKPTFRSSAIFPVIYRPGTVSSRILFMGYWILKRDIKEIARVVTLRSESGEVLCRSSDKIQDAKAYCVELKDYLELSGLSTKHDFLGSLEVEFFSTAHLVFPYPATVLNYYGPHFCTVVHTAQRIYNDFDDMRANSETAVPEAGFNIYADAEREPFFSLINGCEPVPDATLKMTFYNDQQQSIKHEVKLGTLAPYQTLMVYPAHYVDLKAFLKGKAGTAKIKFKVNWAFPRLVVGNLHKKTDAISITHTYYDCSDAETPKDYWRPAEEGWNIASLMIPLTLDLEDFTTVYFYPIYSPSHFAIDIEIYDPQGKRLFVKPGALKMQPHAEAFQKIDFKGICKEAGIPLQQPLAARLIAKTVDQDSRIPSRIKLGLDLGKGADLFPCNICTNLVPFNPDLENKPRTFRWLPILADQPSATFWVMNSSQEIQYRRSASLTLTFFREQDTQTLVRNLILPPHGFEKVCIEQDEELRLFFNQHIGWLTVVSDTPHILTYYFASHPNGSVGGDHGF